MTSRECRLSATLSFLISLLSIINAQAVGPLDQWTDAERNLIKSLSIDRLPALDADPSNRYSGNTNAAALGKELFFDKRFSRSGEISCASCHQPNYHFSDEKPVAVGLRKTTRRSMPLAGVAHNRWFFWDGRADSLWAQALQPFEDENEHGISRTFVSSLIAKHYRNQYEHIAGKMPTLDYDTLPQQASPAANAPSDRQSWASLSPEEQKAITSVFVNGGKFIAAFVETLTPARTPFDQYASALAQNNSSELDALSAPQKRGLRLFVTKAKCINCHNGPRLSNGEFHHVGVKDHGAADPGRAEVIQSLLDNEFGFLGKWSDANAEKDGAHLRFLDTSPRKYRQAFKTPSLRGVADRPPYMHAGQLKTVAAVLKHYDDVANTPLVDEAFHGEITEQERFDLEEFLKALSSRPAQ